ncbi:hypothetical protein ACSSS7_008419 [Eimeria intestinalis]
MATPWTLRSGVPSPIRSVNEAPQAKAVGDLSTATISVGPDDLLSTHRHAHKTLTGTGALALVLAALALTYLLVTCMRHLSKGLTLSSQQSRVLASDFSGENEGACQEPASDEEQETEPADTEGLEPEGAGVAPLPEDLGAHGPAPAAPAGRTRRVLPGSVKKSVGRTLLLLGQPTTILTPLIPLLRPDHCLGTVRTLCKIVALELSAFATVPSFLQPLRRQVAQVYSDLIERVLTTEPTAGEAVRLGWDGSLRSLQLLLQRLAQVPPETETLPVKSYKMMMENQRRLCHWMCSQVLNALQVIQFIKTQDPSPHSDDTVFMQCGVLDSLFLARRQQVLRGLTLMHWLERQQRDLGLHLTYDLAAVAQARQSPAHKMKDKLDEIRSAVLAAGGQPASQLAHLPPLSGEQQQPQQQRPLLPQPGHHPHPGAPDAHPPQAHGPLHMHFSPVPGQHTHPPAQPIPQAPHMPPPPPAAAQPPGPFDPVQQDSLFPAVNPGPQLSGSAGQSQTPQASSQQTPADPTQDSSSEEDDA